MALDKSNQKQVDIDANAQAELLKLVERRRAKKSRQTILRRLVVLVLLLFSLPTALNVYCSYVIGTNYEAIIIRIFPHFTEKIVRAAVITDKWYLDVTGPFLNRFRDKSNTEFRKVVIDLGIEATRGDERDVEKIQELRSVVGSSLNALPEPRKSAIAFAVYELPPAKKIVSVTEPQPDEQTDK